jgi:hypothetical protein
VAVATPAPQRSAGRKRLAKQGHALKDGSFPIPNVGFLDKAIRSVGRAKPGKRPAIAALIRKRARQLGPAGMARLKGSWADNTQSAKAMANALYGQLIELGFDPEQAKTETQEFLVLELAKSEMGKDDTATSDQKSPNANSFKRGAKNKFSPDSGAGPNSDALSPAQRAVFKRLMARKLDPKVALMAARRVK